MFSEDQSQHMLENVFLYLCIFRVCACDDDDDDDVFMVYGLNSSVLPPREGFFRHGKNINPYSLQICFLILFLIPNLTHVL